MTVPRCQQMITHYNLDFLVNVVHNNDLIIIFGDASTKCFAVNLTGS